MKKRIGWLGLLLVAMCLAAGCNGARQDANNSASASSAPGSTVVYYMAGKTEANETVDISSKITARITAINGEVGSTVKKGDILIRLDAKDLAAQKVQAQAGVSQARIEIEKAKTNSDYIQKTNDRNQKLYDAGAISQSQLEQSQLALAAAESAVNASQAQLDQAQAALELASTQLENGTIISPISGVINVKKANTGELAVGGATLLTVVNTAALMINAYLPASLTNKIKVGQEVVIRVSEIPDQVFDGQIALIDTVINKDNVLVKVRFSKQNLLIKPGMFAEIGVKK